jgi:hypothetical protein
MKFLRLSFIYKFGIMAKKESSTPKGGSSKGQVRDGHSIGDKVKAWQPTVDRTTTPPKGDDKKK